ncbi:MAG: hypothetical protein DCC58_09165 [Chloroflexi bacterium]|nr:MAG: hypothetical protein DCC58_09165 [Chloroflexota bacterium]
MQRRLRMGPLLAAALVPLVFGMLPAAAALPDDPAYAAVWARTDRPVADGLANRTWMWGPEPFTEHLEEAYNEAPAGRRSVQYYDKSRMEISNPSGDPNGIWYVTNGLLVMELVTGRLQLGDTAFQQREPAQVNVAGDADDPHGPTYATFALLRDLPPASDGALVTTRLARDGSRSDDPSLAARGVRVAQRVTSGPIDHQIAAPFWEFMNATGMVYADGAFSEAPLFPQPYYATGYPIAEPYWAAVQVGGVTRDVLIQCFERRCLTYTPDNPPGWQVEAGNVGRHYYAWRYPTPDDDDDDNTNLRGLVTEVIDGDSIRVALANRTWEVTYIGVNAPSIAGEVECYGPEATARNTQLVLGKTVTLIPDVTFADWSGRLRMYVYIDGVFVNDQLIREGYARAVTAPPDIRFDAQFAAAQAAAQAAGLGLWGACG